MMSFAGKKYINGRLTTQNYKKGEMNEGKRSRDNNWLYGHKLFLLRVNRKES